MKADADIKNLWFSTSRTSPALKNLARIIIRGGGGASYAELLSLRNNIPLAKAPANTKLTPSFLGKNKYSTLFSIAA